MRWSILLLLPLTVLAADAPSTTPVVSGEDAPTYVIAGGKGTAKLLLNASTGSEAAALTILTLSQGAEVPLHAHEASAEILYVEEGVVEMRIGDQTVRAVAGDAIHIPAGVQHSASVHSAFRAVQIYVGPGPEQRFASGERVKGDR